MALPTTVLASCPTILALDLILLACDPASLTHALAILTLDLTRRVAD